MVLPVPGGPQKITEPSLPALTMRLSMPCSPSRWSWPTTSASDDGRKRSASGRGALVGKPGSLEQRGGFLHGFSPEWRDCTPAPRAGRKGASRRGEAPSAFTSPATDVTLSLLSPITRSPRFTPNLAAGVFGCNLEHHDARRPPPRCRAPRRRRAKDWPPWRRPADCVHRRSRASRGGSSTAGMSATVAFIACPWRITPSSAEPPRPLVANRYCKASGSCTGLPSTLTTTSPAFKPGARGGALGMQALDQRAAGRSSPSDSARSCVTGCSEAPNQGRCTLPPCNAA